MLSVDQTRNWLNSIHFHVLALSVGVVAAMVAISLGVVYVIATPYPRVTVYEVARAAQGLPLTRPNIQFTTQYAPSIGVYRPTRAEAAIASALAEKLAVPLASIQVKLGDRDQVRSVEFEHENRLYGRDNANPSLAGPFRISIKTAVGWKIVTKLAGSSFGFWRGPGRQVMIGALLVVIPLSYWFSRRLTRSIRAFAQSADELQAGKRGSFVPVDGPTEIRMAARALNEMQARIEGFVQERTTLVAAIAHDLRAPLARLEFQLLNAPPDVIIAASGQIHEMERLITMIMEFVEQETKQIAPEPLDLTMLIDGISEDFQDLGKSVVVNRLEPVIVCGDSLLLRRLFANVIENAVAYGGNAVVSLRVEGSDAVIEVVDEGPGMTDLELEHAFEPFFRGEPSRNRQTGGTGLGLSIVKSAADMHGATVGLTNGQAGGLIVRVVIPIASVGRQSTTSN